ncbi:MAG: biotin/lipoyl-binding protein [Armatimonadetes bacterium]|nr:biotin/lipoyl-binding protein [Armatimonadota bacterium]
MSTPVVAPMVGKVISVDVKPGDKVKKNDVLAVIEAMKMHVKIFSPADGEVQEIKVSPGQQVNRNDVLVTLN